MYECHNVVLACTHLNMPSTAGVKVWFDKMRDEGRDKTGMMAGVKNTKLFLALISPKYFQSEWCLMELTMALESKKKIALAHHGCTDPHTALSWIPDKFCDLKRDELIMMLEAKEYFQVGKGKLERLVAQ
ncbi:MAG: hypothetical protein SGPRY_012110 [Prymnesium sp.]